MESIPKCHMFLQPDTIKFHVNPLSDETVRSLLSPVTVEGMVATVVSRTMTRKSRGPTVTVQRIVSSESVTACNMHVACHIHVHGLHKNNCT